jgi:hypothetical protein
VAVWASTHPLQVQELPEYSRNMRRRAGGHVRLGHGLTVPHIRSPYSIRVDLAGFLVIESRDPGISAWWRAPSERCEGSSVRSLREFTPDAEKEQSARAADGTVRYSF